jgi:dinuclear metal center YbgI/SA1388 family protein
MIDRNFIIDDLNQYLNIHLYDDYCPNGLQVEGKEKIQTIAFAVSATYASIQKAIALKADMLIVHHGLFWKFHGAKTITGPFGKRLIPLIQHQINLLAYHLPLDAHLECGNARAIADLINLQNIRPFGDYKKMPTGVCGELAQEQTVKQLQDKLSSVLNHPILLSTSDENAFIHSVGIITGGANSQWTQAYDNGLDAYISGEMSEHDWHEAKEAGIHFFAGGHNATEQFGVQRLIKYLHNKYGSDQLNLFYIPSENPA